MKNKDTNKNKLINEVIYTPFFINRIANNADIDISKYDIKQLTIGFKVELEHSDVTGGNPVETLRIAMKHLDEVPDYYTKLEKYVEPDLMRENSVIGNSNNKHQLKITKSVDNITPERANLIAEFIGFCCKNLGINIPCKIYLTGRRGGPIQTTASFNPNNNEIWIYVKNRNMLADPLRSLAHELRHLKQGLDNVLTPTSGDDGSEHENEAHAFSGLMIRLFGKSHPEIFE